MKTITIALPAIEEINFKITVIPEDASPYDDFEKDEADEILKDLDSNEWAWCIIEVTAEWKGLETSELLGGCNYKDEEQFRMCDYFADMKQQAYEDLISKIELLAK